MGISERTNKKGNHIKVFFVLKIEFTDAKIWSEKFKNTFLNDRME